jgi:hypothetical protein
LVLAVNGCKIEGNNPNKQRQIIDFIDFRKNLILSVGSRQSAVGKNSRGRGGNQESGVKSQQPKPSSPIDKINQIKIRWPSVVLRG